MNYYKKNNLIIFKILFFLLFFNIKILFAWEIKDDTNQVFTGKYLPKIITLAPHLTELAFSAGLENQLIGVSDYSDYPESAKKIPSIGNAWTINLEQLFLLKPDLIIAWENGSPKAQIEQLKKHGFRVVLLKSEQLTDPARHLLLLSQLADKKYQINTQKLSQNYLLTLNLLQKNKVKKTKKLFYLISNNPMYTVSSASTIGQAMQFCGGNNIFAELKLPAPIVNIESILVKQPDLILHSISDQKSQQNLQLFWQKWLPKTKIIYIPEDNLVRPSLRFIHGIESICHAVK